MKLSQTTVNEKQDIWYQNKHIGYQKTYYLWVARVEDFERSRRNRKF